MVRPGSGVVGEVGGQHVVWQGGGSDGGDVEIFITQTAHGVGLRGDRRRDNMMTRSFTFVLHFCFFIEIKMR